MRGGAVVLLLSLTAIGAYWLGRQDAEPARSTGGAVHAPLVVVPANASKPTALLGAPVAPPAFENQKPPAPSKAMPSVPAPTSPKPAEQTSQSSTTRKVEAALTAAAIAAILVQASRAQYHATGRPCACPDDTMRNGRACGGRSAYSRPGGAAPLCYPHDVTTAMIDDYRKKAAR